ncbi:endonuclease/exonuclease/phosphatase family protein [Plantactinospora sp. GCM10030261]|uniref:endonuclease/exonuclease/phosphatase family protein n=1 Tax=Plantactinospora sp. GCM10030261 TaxID=3273420 RepID=UPI0036181BEF
MTAGNRLRVMSYNVHSQRDDLAALAAAVRALAPDVVLVQEAPRRFRWRHGCAALAERLGMVVAVGGLPALGNLVLTTLRVRVHRTWTTRFPLTPGRHLRGAAFAECSVGPAPDGSTVSRFVVVGSHLSLDPVERSSQAGLLRAELADVELPVIIGADVNERPDGAAWRTMADGLVDTAVAAGRADVLTFPCPTADRRIDAIFVDPRVQVVDCQVPDTEQIRRASDHYPVLADLLLG